MTKKYSDIPASRIQAVGKILKKEIGSNAINDSEMAIIHRFMVNQLPPEDAAYRILELRDAYNGEDDD